MNEKYKEAEENMLIDCQNWDCERDALKEAFQRGTELFKQNTIKFQIELTLNSYIEIDKKGNEYIPIKGNYQKILDDIINNLD